LAVIPSGPCGQPLIDFNPGQLILPAGSFGAVPVNAQGEAWIGIPIPNLPILSGVRVYAQWGVADMSVPLGFALSPIRTYIIW
jgi:hypothetical protein